MQTHMAPQGFVRGSGWRQAPQGIFCFGFERYPPCKDERTDFAKRRTESLGRREKGLVIHGRMASVTDLAKGFGEGTSQRVTERAWTKRFGEKRRRRAGAEFGRQACWKALAIHLAKFQKQLINSSIFSVCGLGSNFGGNTEKLIDQHIVLGIFGDQWRWPSCALYATRSLSQVRERPFGRQTAVGVACSCQW